MLLNLKSFGIGQLLTERFFKHRHGIFLEDCFKFVLHIVNNWFSSIIKWRIDCLLLKLSELLEEDHHMIIQSEMSYLVEDIETLAFNCFVGIFQCSVAAAINALLWDPHQLIDPVRRHHERNFLLFLPRRQMQRPKLYTSGNHYRLFDKVLIDEVFLDDRVDCF